MHFSRVKSRVNQSMFMYAFTASNSRVTALCLIWKFIFRRVRKLRVESRERILTDFHGALTSHLFVFYYAPAHALPYVRFPPLFLFWCHPSLDVIPVYVFPVRWFQFYANWFSAIACANRLSEAISHSSSVIMGNIMHIVSKVRI